MDITVRSIEREDATAVVELIREFAAHEHMSDLCRITTDRLAAAMFEEKAFLEGIIAVDGDRAVGYALFFPNFSSFRGQCGLYLDDIYVTSDYRSSGVGRAMLRHISQIAIERGLERIDFLVSDVNTRGIGFYKSLGAVNNAEERHFKIAEESLRGLAA